MADLSSQQLRVAALLQEKKETAIDVISGLGMRGTVVVEDLVKEDEEAGNDFLAEFDKEMHHMNERAREAETKHHELMEPLHRVFRYADLLSKPLSSEEQQGAAAAELEIDVPMPKSPNGEETELTPAEFKRQWIKACSALQGRFKQREDMYRQRWEVSTDRLEHALGDILEKSRTLTELRTRIEALRKAVKVAEKERNDITRMSMVPLCRDIHLLGHGGHGHGHGAGETSYDVECQAFPDMKDRQIECNLIRPAMVTDLRQRLALTILAGSLKRMTSIAKAGTIWKLQAKAGLSKIYEKRLRSLHNELKKTVDELLSWKSGTGAQAKAGRNALYRSFFNMKLIDEMIRSAILAGLHSWRNNMSFQVTAAKLKEDGEKAMEERTKLKQQSDVYRARGLAMLERHMAAHTRSLAKARLWRWHSGALQGSMEEVRRLQEAIVARDRKERLERGGTIIYYVKKRWGKKELTGAFSRMRQTMIREKAEDLADVMRDRRQRRQSKQVNAMLEQGDLAAAAAAIGEDETVREGASLADIAAEEEKMNHHVVSDEERQREAREKADAATKEAEAGAARMKELEQSVAEAEVRFQKQQEEMSAQIALAEKKAEARIAKMTAEAEHRAQLATEAAAALEAQAQEKLSNSEKVQAEAEKTAKETQKAAEAAQATMDAAVDKAGKQAAREQLEAAKAAVRLANEVLAGASLQSQRLNDELEVARQRQEEEAANGKLELMLAKEKAEAEMREVHAAVDEKAREAAEEEAKKAMEGQERMKREIEVCPGFPVAVWNTATDAVCL